MEKERVPLIVSLQRVAEEWRHSKVICMIFAYHSSSSSVVPAYLREEGSGTQADKNILLEFKLFHFFLSLQEEVSRSFPGLPNEDRPGV